ncbi:MAG: lipid A deacylase LpxR family protein [Bdellovibrionales bacterium]
MSLLYRLVLSLTLVVCFLSFGSKVACATDQETRPPTMGKTTTANDGDNNYGRLKLINENDWYVSNDDRHYTQGARLSYLSGRVTPDGFWDQSFLSLGSVLPIFSNESQKRKYSLMFGQSLFTPQNTSRVTPSVKDRPYGAWFYTGASLLQESVQPTHHTLENFEVQAGVVGRWALGGVTQNDYHQFINVKPSMGWENQLQNEPGVILTYGRKWRFQQPLYGNLAVDIIPELGASAGNIMTYGQGTALLRFGQNLAADYGPSRIRPGPSGTDWFDSQQLNGKFGWYLFAGTQGRAVARNIFLDGNTFASSPHVDKKPFVADFTVGGSLFWSDAARLDLALVQRTKEFDGQVGHLDRFGGINLTVLFW